jgi:N-dimethylarginine dimethylaminohydrolase
MNTILMSNADQFSIQYIINPWMTHQVGKSNSPKAFEQWQQLRDILKQFSTIHEIESSKEQPDLVFTANAATIKDKKCVLSRFKHSERQGEEAIYRQWFEDQGYGVIILPEGIYFEGAGDALFNHDQSILWMGYGYRTDKTAATELEKIFDTTVIALQLTDSRFYHLDTCFCPLDGGHVMYFPDALNAAAIAEIHKYYTHQQQIIVSEEDALHFACNAVCVNSLANATNRYTVILNQCSPALKETLNNKGYDLVQTPMSEFLKAGGATKCLTLQL